MLEAVLLHEGADVRPSLSPSEFLIRRVVFHKLFSAQVEMERFAGFSHDASFLSAH